MQSGRAAAHGGAAAPGKQVARVGRSNAWRENELFGVSSAEGSRDMLVEQAIFTSLRSRRSQGYHLVASSPGLDPQLARQLCTWGPSHASLLDDRPKAESLNFHPLSDDWYALSRTVYGGPEYSGRGGLQVFTHFLLLRSEQLSGYDNNPLVFARTARLLGNLRLLANIPAHLPPVELPTRPLKGCGSQLDRRVHLRDDVFRNLTLQHRIAVLGLPDPLPALAQILRDLSGEDRLNLSFTTGLKPSVHRSFRLHFVDSVDAQLHAQLSQQGIDLRHRHVMDYHEVGRDRELAVFQQGIIR